jgi:hypothetical protein
MNNNYISSQTSVTWRLLDTLLHVEINLKLPRDQRNVQSIVHARGTAGMREIVYGVTAASFKTINPMVSHGFSRLADARLNTRAAITDILPIRERSACLASFRRWSPLARHRRYKPRAILASLNPRECVQPI